MIASRDKVHVQRLKDLLNTKFEIKDLGDAKKIHGIETVRDLCMNLDYLTRRLSSKVLWYF